MPALKAQAQTPPGFWQIKAACGPLEAVKKPIF
jgi:hypothetical protein